MHDNLQAILTQSSWLVAVALGVNFALLTGGVDLSAGSIMYVSAVAIGLAFGQVPALIALPAAAVIGIVYGTLNGVLVVRFGVPAFIVTLATAFVGRGLGLYLSSTQVVLAGSAIADLGRARLGLPAPLWIAIAAFGVAWVLLRALPFGRYVLAAGADLAGARRAGVPVGPVLIGVYMISGFFAGIGGFISFSQTSAASAAFGQGAEFLSIAAAVLGGTSLFGGRGSLYAPVLGAVLIQTVQNGLVLLDVNPYAQPLITGAIIFAAALLDSMRLRLATYFDRRSDIAR
jgi:ribose transport system permease protein